MSGEADVELLRRMLEIYSPSGSESELASFLYVELTERGFSKVRLDKVGNVYGEIGSGSPTLMFCGHMDTVPGRMTVKVEGGRIYGRGAVDAKAPLAAMISAASKFLDHLKTGRLILACVVDEEGFGRGIRGLIREGVRADFALFGEPSGICKITFAYKGRVYVRFRLSTPTGHVGAQHIAINAAEKGCQLWWRLRDLSETYRSKQGIFYSLTPCLIGLRSWRTCGGVPDICNLDVDVRLPPKIKVNEAIEILNNAVDAFKAENKQVSIDIKIKDMVEPFVADRGSALMKALREAICEVTGLNAVFVRKTGTGDMNIYGSTLKIPVATYGPGNSSLAHTPVEFIEVEEYLSSINVYEGVIRRILHRVG
ncbi:MAG: M20/M25/M40 family metallo-hydrolase [Nitrososphaerota archaeon]|nr:M20/M25/M40 family metallo-hydrolase [Candidatus Bathyarchaeota archaeon]MDW8048430.1 M20/M25/M40 family metallo-hydrolase [Nitrososphaerota archaeon]